MSQNESERSMDTAASPQRDEGKPPNRDTFWNFLVHWATGIISGGIMGILIVPVTVLDDDLHTRHILLSEIAWRMIFQAIAGGCAGFLVTPVFLFINDFWPRTSHPIAVATIYASAVGTFFLGLLSLTLFEARNAQDHLLNNLITIGAFMILAGLFGLIQASLARLVINRWEQSRRLSA
jgi:hypothetical protein